MRNLDQLVEGFVEFVPWTRGKLIGVIEKYADGNLVLRTGPGSTGKLVDEGLMTDRTERYEPVSVKKLIEKGEWNSFVLDGKVFRGVNGNQRRGIAATRFEAHEVPPEPPTEVREDGTVDCSRANRYRAERDEWNAARSQQAREWDQRNANRYARENQAAQSRQARTVVRAG